MNQAAIELYISRLPYSEFFVDLQQEVKDKVIFSASEMLRRRFAAAAVITDEMIALQALFVVEGEKEEFAKFKRHNLSSVQVEDLRLNFNEKGEQSISPEVVAIVDAQLAEKQLDATTFFGRLV